MNFGAGVFAAVALMVVPGAVVGRVGGLRWPLAVAVGPALTFGTVALAIVPFGAIGIRWNAVSAVLVFAAAIVVTAAVCRVIKGPPPREPFAGRSDLIAAAGVLFGAVAIGYAAWRGMPHWQSVPSTWDSVWHANTIRWILDTGQASPTHMGELRNVETKAQLYYPSAFHALAAVFAELTGAAPTTAYTLSALAAAVWLFPASAGLLTWQFLTGKTDRRRAAGAAATAAALSASFTAVPYVEFDTAAIPNLVAYGLAAPTFVLVTSSVRYPWRIPLAVLATVGVFSVHITGGVIVVTFVAAWWLLDAIGHPVVTRARDVVVLAAIGASTLAVLLPQFVGVLRQAEIIVGHAFVTHLGKKRAVLDAVVQHTRHLNDFPIQNIIIGLAGAGFLMLLAKRIWWPAAVWLLLIVSIVHSSAPFGGPVGSLTGTYSDLFYSDPRRLSAVVTLLLAPMAGIALYTAVAAVVGWIRRRSAGGGARRGRGIWDGATAVLLVLICFGITWHYFPRHRYLIGEKYDRVIVNDGDLEAFAHLAELPGARDSVIGDANVDGTAWMYAVADLHPLWTHYDYPVQQGPGYNRFIIWAYADDADRDPRVAEAVRALNIRYIMTSSPVVRGFVMPDGLVSLDKSKSWAKIYDNGGSRIYQWRGPH